MKGFIKICSPCHGGDRTLRERLRVLVRTIACHVCADEGAVQRSLAVTWASEHHSARTADKTEDNSFLANYDYAIPL